jgi:putrescine importer
MVNNGETPLSNNQGVKLKRVLSLPYLVAFGLAYLAPTVVFNYYGIMSVMTHGMMALAYVITTIVMFFTAYSYARMVEAFPVAGSAYTYVQQSINPYAGFFAGWLMLLDYLLLPMICYLLLGIYVNEFFPQIPIWSIVVFFVLAGAFINIIGTKTAARVNTIIICCCYNQTCYGWWRYRHPCF